MKWDRNSIPTGGYCNLQIWAKKQGRKRSDRGDQGNQITIPCDGSLLLCSNGVSSGKVGCGSKRGIVENEGSGIGMKTDRDFAERRFYWQSLKESRLSWRGLNHSPYTITCSSSNLDGNRLDIVSNRYPPTCANPKFCHSQQDRRCIDFGSRLPLWMRFAKFVRRNLLGRRPRGLWVFS